MSSHSTAGFDVDDIGMRNLAIVALTDAGRRVDEVAGPLDEQPQLVDGCLEAARNHQHRKVSDVT